MRDAEATVTRLRRLKELGVMIAIDDFGTGYSSLAYLRQFPVDVLKIDGSFVSELGGSSDAAALIHTLVELGRILGLITLAEGIETPSQLEGLRAELCDRGQGFLFSPPVAPEAFPRAGAAECAGSGARTVAPSARRWPPSRAAPYRPPPPRPPAPPAQGWAAAFFRRCRSRITSRSTTAPSAAAMSSTQIRLSWVLKTTNPTFTVWLLSRTKATSRTNPTPAATSLTTSRVSRFFSTDPEPGAPEVVGMVHSFSSPGARRPLVRQYPGRARGARTVAGAGAGPAGGRP